MSKEIKLSPLKAFVQSLTALLDTKPGESEILEKGKNLLKQLVLNDDWLPEAYAQPHPQYYQQYLLYADPASRFSIVSFVWGPGQITPIHNHTVWGLIGVLRGAEFAQNYEKENGKLVKTGEAQRLVPGNVEAVSPTIGDLHQVKNAYDDQVSISIHVYGADIGKVQRSVFFEDGTEKVFVSGYSNIVPPFLDDLVAYN